jgi:hypothetical protein
LLEVKGQDDQQNRIKFEFLNEWIKAVNAHVGFGQWALGGIHLKDSLQHKKCKDIVLSTTPLSFIIQASNSARNERLPP